MELAAVSAAMFVIDSMQTNGQLPDATRFPRITVGIFSAGKHEWCLSLTYRNAISIVALSISREMHTLYDSIDPQATSLGTGLYTVILKWWIVLATILR